MSKKIILACMCVLALSSCKKDYQKLATEFERALPDTLEVLTEQINEVDHFIYYKNKSNTELIRYDLEKETRESVKPELSNGETIYGIYMGNENIAFLKRTTMASTFETYNLKTQKFKEIESFWGTEMNDAIPSENDKTITGYVGLNGGPTTKYVYNFDGNKISEEEEVDPIGDLDVPSLKYWQCMYCGLVIKSSNKPEDKQNDCPKREHSYLMYTPHVWQYIGDVQ